MNKYYYLYDVTTFLNSGKYWVTILSFSNDSLIFIPENAPDVFNYSLKALLDSDKYFSEMRPGDY